MTLDEFRELAETYGGDLGAWPASTRAAAALFAGENPEASAVLDEAKALDARLAAALPAALADAPAPSEALVARVLAEAAQSTRPSRSLGARQGPNLAALLEPIVEALGGWIPARVAFGGIAAAAVVGLVVGIAAPMPPGGGADRRDARQQARQAADPLVELAFAIGDPFDDARPRRRFRDG